MEFIDSRQIEELETDYTTTHKYFEYDDEENVYQIAIHVHYYDSPNDKECGITGEMTIKIKYYNNKTLALLQRMVYNRFIDEWGGLVPPTIKRNGDDL